MFAAKHNENYINIIENSCSNKLDKVGVTLALLNRRDVINKFLNHTKAIQLH